MKKSDSLQEGLFKPSVEEIPSWMLVPAVLLGILHVCVWAAALKVRAALRVEAGFAKVTLSSCERANKASPSCKILLSASCIVSGWHTLGRGDSNLRSLFLCEYVTFRKSLVNMISWNHDCEDAGKIAFWVFWNFSLPCCNAHNVSARPKHSS